MFNKEVEKSYYKDGYRDFLSYFSIDRNELYKWGLESTIFPSVSKVEVEWSKLKERIFNDKTVFIRGYGRDAHGTQLYKDLYKKLFNNFHVEKDPTNNAEPQKTIQRITGLKRNSDIYNYQVSHIWGKTKNIFLFEAPWNICYTPKIMDPFTGHESKGIYSEEYQKIFTSKAYELYKSFIDEYNYIIKEYDVQRHAKEFISSLNDKIIDKDLIQFSKDVTNELSLIVI